MAKKYVPKDRFFQKAKDQRFVARSVFKLEELDDRFQLFRRGHRVVDLGCAPGSWLQYIAGKVGPKGIVVGYDIVVPAVLPAPIACFHQVDVLALTVERIASDMESAVEEQKKRASRPPNVVSSPELGSLEVSRREALTSLASHVRIDAVVSDMAPKLIGIRDADQARSFELASHALGLATRLLSSQGVFVTKVFQGRDIDTFLLHAKQAFKEVKVVRPEATRDGSRETFVVGRLLKTGSRTK